MTKRTYDSGGRVFRESGPMQVPLEYFYSSNGQLGSVTSPAVRIDYRYDERGNRNSVSTNLGWTFYTFDAACTANAINLEPLNAGNAVL